MRTGRDPGLCSWAPGRQGCRAFGRALALAALRPGAAVAGGGCPTRHASRRPASQHLAWPTLSTTRVPPPTAAVATVTAAAVAALPPRPGAGHECDRPAAAGGARAGRRRAGGAAGRLPRSDGQCGKGGCHRGGWGGPRPRDVCRLPQYAVPAGGNDTMWPRLSRRLHRPVDGVLLVCWGKLK